MPFLTNYLPRGLRGFDDDDYDDGDDDDDDDDIGRRGADYNVGDPKYSEEVAR